EQLAVNHGGSLVVVHSGDQSRCFSQQGQAFGGLCFVGQCDFQVHGLGPTPAGLVVGRELPFEVGACISVEIPALEQRAGRFLQQGAVADGGTLAYGTATLFESCVGKRRQVGQSFCKLILATAHLGGTDESSG